MALTEFYVDPSIAGDSGTGTVGDPYGDLEFCLANAAHPSSGGGRINVKAGTSEIIAAELDVLTNYSSVNAITDANPLVFQGYTTAAADGGQGSVGAGGSNIPILLEASQDNVSFVDLRLHSTGNQSILNLDNRIYLINCEFDSCTNSAPVTVDDGQVWGCYFHNLTGASQILNQNFGSAGRNLFVDAGANSFAGTVMRNSGFATFQENIIWIDSVGVSGISYGDQGSIILNSIYNNTAGTGKGIFALAATSGAGAVILNNLVEGFSGTGGIGIESATADTNTWHAGNAVFDNTTEYSIANRFIQRDADDNEELSASPFTDAANQDFSPVDTGNVKEGSQPDKIGNF